MTIQPGLLFQSVSLLRPRRAILRDASLDAPSGEITVLFGPSGAGKTTCLRLIAGLEKPDTGVIRMRDRVFSSPEIFLPPRKRRVGFCFQDDALWPALTVREHIDVATNSQCEEHTPDTINTMDYLSRYGLTDLANRYPLNLSGGEKKRLALARALAVNPDILLLDEPLSSLDGPAREELIACLADCRHPERSVLLVTHQLDEAFALGDRLVLLVDGQIVQRGLFRDVLRQPCSRLAARLLGYRNFFAVQIEEGMAVSLLGRWPLREELREPVTAAWFPQDILAIPDPAGTARVEFSWPEMRHFRLHARYNKEIVEGISEAELSSGQCVSLNVLHTPALFEDRG